MSENNIVFVGTFVSAKSLGKLSIFRGFIHVDESGLICLKGSKSEFDNLESNGHFRNCKIIHLRECELMIPGFVDCHTHGPQYPNIGVGLDRPLLEWLDKYTFPLEKKYSDVVFAKNVYDQVVECLLNNGTTTACYFGSIHLDGTLKLVEAVINHKQRALVGKVSMNIPNSANYYNSTDKELKETEEFVQSVLALNNNLVTPIITPRFAVSCDEELMTGLSTIANAYGCRIQSHISENSKEIEQVLKMFPDCRSYADVYDKSNILKNGCIMAHAVYLDESEMALLASKGVSVAHCPASNTRLRSGLCPVRKLLENHVTVGLGTDVSGGDNASILDAMRRAMDVSTHLELLNVGRRALDWKEAFYLATMGGAKALSLDDTIGDFEVGKYFDALRINVYEDESPIKDYNYSAENIADEETSSLLQRFIHLGDDRNITEVYVKGVQVKQCKK